MRFGVRADMSALLSGDPALAGSQSKAVLAAASTETNEQVLGTSVVEITGVRRGERPAKFACPIAGIVDAGRLRSKGGRIGITDPGYNDDPSHKNKTRRAAAPSGRGEAL